jgi:hypothetical protein
VYLLRTDSEEYKTVTRYLIFRSGPSHSDVHTFNMRACLERTENNYNALFFRNGPGDWPRWVVMLCRLLGTDSENKYFCIIFRNGPDDWLRGCNDDPLVLNRPR